MTPDDVARIREESDRAFMDVRCPDTWTTPRQRMIARIWFMQRGICALCGHDLPHQSRMKGANRLSLDHVYPKDRRRLRPGTPRPFGLGEQRLRRAGLNYVCAHGKCNSEKGNRAPTGCELIWLAAVNARRGYAPPWTMREERRGQDEDAAQAPQTADAEDQEREQAPGQVWPHGLDVRQETAEQAA